MSSSEMDGGSGSEGVSVYAEAKGEYTKQLCQYLVPALQQYFLDLLEEAKEKEPDGKKLLTKYQDLLETISEWNMDKVQRETAALTAATHCDYLEELLTAVFIAHTKVLSAIRITAKQKKLQITIPKLDHFLHRTLTECARLLWSNTFLVSPSAPSIERQKNMRQIESLLYDGVHQAIRTMLPVKNILREYLKGEDDGSDSEEEEEDTEGGATAPAAAAADSAEQAVEAKETAKPEEVVAAPLEFTGLSVPAEPALAPPATTAIETDIPAEEEDMSASSDAADEIQIFEGAVGEALDDFEDLDAPAAAAAPPKQEKKDDDILPMDFEELS